jgi:hypothetical protein
MLALKICLVAIILSFVFKFLAQASVTDVDKLALKYTGQIHSTPVIIFGLLVVLCRFVAVVSGIWGIWTLL